MKIKLLALILALTLATAAAAAPPPPGYGHGPNPGHVPGWGPPPPPPKMYHGPRPAPRWTPPPRHYYYGGRHYDRWYGYDDGWFAGGLGLGILVSAMLNNQAQMQAQADAQAREQAYALKMSQVSSAATNIASQQSAHVMQIISQAGPDQALADLNNYWHSQGQATFLDARTPVSVLKVAGFQQDLTLVYTVDRTTNNVTVSVLSPQYNITQTSTAQYTPPAPVLPKETSKLLGFTLTDDARTPEGFLIVQSLVPATAAAYAGVKNDAVLYKVDGNSTAQVNVAQLNAYLQNRAAANAIVAVTFSDNGKQKTANIKL